MSKLRDRMINDMQLHGYGKRTQEAYARTVRQLQQFYNLSPENISEEQLRDYFIHRRNVSHWSASTMRITYHLQRDQVLLHVHPQTRLGRPDAGPR